MNIQEIQANAKLLRDNDDAIKKLAGNIRATCPMMAEALDRCRKKLARRTPEKPNRGLTHLQILRGSLINATSVKQLELDAANWLQSVPETLTHDSTGEEVP